MPTESSKIILSEPAKDLPALWQKETVSFRKLLFQNEKSAKALLSSKITEMFIVLGIELNQLQTKFFLRYFMNKFSYLTTDDISLFTDFLAENKIFGKISVPVLINKLGEYDKKRAEAAMDFAEQENSNFKGDGILPAESVLKAYQNVIKEPTKDEKNKLQSEKDKLAIERNQEKIKTIEKLYPKK